MGFHLGYGYGYGHGYATDGYQWVTIVLLAAGAAGRACGCRLPAAAAGVSWPVCSETPCRRLNPYKKIGEVLFLDICSDVVQLTTYLILVSRPNTTGSVHVMIPIVWKYPGVCRRKL